MSRLYAHSKNYDMDLTLDYNLELFPLQTDQSFALALASSLVRGGGAAGTDGTGEDGDDNDVWRPDGKGRRGLEEDYDYVMYGKVGVFTTQLWRMRSTNGIFRSTNLMAERKRLCRSFLT